MATFDFVLFVHKDSPLKTVRDVIDAAKANPEKFNFGSISVGTAQNLSTLNFVAMAGLNVPTVPFRTTGEVITGLVSGNIQAAFETIPGVIGQINGGTLRAIAVSSTKRVPFLPDVPTVAESGVPGYRTYSWNGIVAPAKTPSNIVAKVNKEFNSAIATPEIQKRFRELIMEPRTGTPEDLQKMYDEDVLMWRKIITEAKNSAELKPARAGGHQEIHHEHHRKDQSRDRAVGAAARHRSARMGDAGRSRRLPIGWSIFTA